MHPMIKPALRRGWHDRQTVRYGITPSHSVLLGPLDTATESFLTLLDGTRGLPALRAAAKRLGLGASAADRLSERLADAGVLEDATADRAAAARVSERLRPDLAAQTLLTRAPGAGVRKLTARRQAWVQIRGAGRVGAALAVALTQAGVGRVDVVDGGRVEPGDTSPGGIPAAYTGRRRDGAARAVVRAAVPWQRPQSERPERLRLVIFAPRDGFRAYVPDPAPAEEVLAAGTPHLYAGVVEATGFVGPLVLPGRSACAGCLLRHRTRHEPGLPLLMGQWRTARTPGVPACDAALAVTVAGLAAATALTFLDEALGTPAGVRSELALPDLEMTREHVEPHAECPCGAGERASATAGSEPRAPENRSDRAGNPLTAAALVTGGADAARASEGAAEGAAEAAAGLGAATEREGTVAAESVAAEPVAAEPAAAEPAESVASTAARPNSTGAAPGGVRPGDGRPAEAPAGPGPGLGPSDGGEARTAATPSAEATGPSSGSCAPAGRPPASPTPAVGERVPEQRRRGQRLRSPAGRRPATPQRAGAPGRRRPDGSGPVTPAGGR